MLEQNNAKATFFLLGRNIKGREAIVRRIAEQGHEICSHGYDHLHYWKVSPFRAIKDIKRGWQAIDVVLGTNRAIYPFRPPHGKLNLISWLYLLVHHVPIVYWLVDSGDTWLSPPDNQRVALLMKKTGGTVSLIHDFDRSDNLSDNRRGHLVLESVRLALAMAKDKGMRVLTVSELLDDRK
jgi:peptidoglycan/xylan/chitin deacetylase (PgdA/CDA1 family)